MEPMLASLDHPDLRNPIMEHGSYNAGVLVLYNYYDTPELLQA